MNFDADLIASLEEYGTVLTTRLSAGQSRPTFGRDRDVEKLRRHLLHAKNNSFILLGPSGCGKTAVLHELTRRVDNAGEAGWLLLETSTSRLMAGTVYIGEWQTRLQELIEIAKRSNRIAVYVTDIANMIGAGRHSKSDENMAGFVASFVERGELTLIGECTPDAFRHGIERHPSFKRLFSVFPVQEQGEDEIRQVVRQVAEASAQSVAEEYGLQFRFPDNALAAMEEFGRLYFVGTAAPGGAIALLDHLIKNKTDPAELEQADGGELSIEYRDVVHTLESFTGIPSLLLDDSRALKVTDVRQFFDSRVLGQKDAVDAVIDLITLIKAGLTDPGKPMGVLFFVGPTGVGKTELAKALAEFIFGSPERMIRFDMSEFKDYHSFEKLIGSASARDDSPMQTGSLLARVRQQPFSVILLDEIEKAHPNIFDLLLQVFDDGRLTDPLGRTTNFTKTIIVMTSNLGSDLRATSFGFRAGGEDDPYDETAAVLEDFFRPEFLNRIDRVITFTPLQRDEIRILAQRELGQVLLRSGITRRELRVDVDPGVIDILVEHGFSETYGARPLKRAVEQLALLPIARQIVNLAGDCRQALLRLLPGNKRIHVKIVQDRTSRKRESIARGVPVVDPVRGTKNKLKPTQIESRVEELQSLVQSIVTECADRNLEHQKTELVARTSEVDFWDDASEAREVLGDIYRIERLLEAVEKVKKRTEDLERLLDSARRRKDRDQFTTVAERAVSVRQHAELLQYSLSCDSRVDRCDAFVAISTVETELREDLVGQIADMYAEWAKLKGFQTTWVHEDLFDPKTTKELVLLIEGVAIYGILRAEEGIHEMVYGKTSKTERSSQFVKVRVLPVIDDPMPDGSNSDLNIHKQRSRGRGLRCRNYKSRVTITDRARTLTVTGRNHLSPDESADHLSDLMHAELRRVQHHRQSGQAEASEQVIRRYTIRPNPSARDLRTEITTHHLNELWKGAIDEFLAAGIALRHQLPEAADRTIANPQ